MPERTVRSPSFAPALEHLLTIGINHFLRGQPLQERLSDMCGKRFRLHIDDADLSLTFEIAAAGIVRTAADPHVTIRGPLRDFIALALRREDPDTLFFQRRLAVEGETETGLHLKNLLDGWEYDAPAHLRAVLPPPLAGAAVRTHGVVTGLSGLIRLRRAGSRCSSRPAETHRAS